MHFINIKWIYIHASYYCVSSRLSTDTQYEQAGRPHGICVGEEG